MRTGIGSKYYLSPELKILFEELEENDELEENEEIE